MLIRKSRILILTSVTMVCVGLGLVVAQEPRGSTVSEKVKCIARFIVVDLQQRGAGGIGTPLSQDSLLFAVERDGGQETIVESEAPGEEKLRHVCSIKLLNDTFPLKTKVAYHLDRGKDRRISIAADELVFQNKTNSMVVYDESGRYLLAVVLMPK